MSTPASSTPTSSTPASSTPGTIAESDQEEIVLYAYQTIARDIIIERLMTATISDPKGAVLTLPCGYGKTLTCVTVVKAINVKTLWLTTICHLGVQACREVNKLAPNIRTAFLPKKPDQPLADADMYFGTLQSIYKRRYPPEFFSSIGLVVVDECHHLAAPTHAQTMCLLPCARFIGLTATPERKDLREQLIYYLVGDSAYKVNRPADGTLTVRYIDLPDSPEVVRANEIVECDVLPCYQKMLARREARAIRELRKEPVDRKEPRGYKKGDRKFLERYNATAVLSPKFEKAYGELGDRMELLGELANYQPQNRLIVDTLVGLTAPGTTPRGGILVLGKLISHLQVLAELYARRTPNVTWGLLTGEETAVEQAAAKGNFVLFASMDLVKEGFDLPRLDTLILASPAESLEQCVGRIQRTVPGIVKQPPVVYDLYNDSTAFNGETHSRIRKFAALGARIKMPRREVHRAQEQVVKLRPQCTGPNAMASAGLKRPLDTSLYEFNFE